MISLNNYDYKAIPFMYRDLIILQNAIYVLLLLIRKKKKYIYIYIYTHIDIRLSYVKICYGNIIIVFLFLQQSQHT